MKARLDEVSLPNFVRAAQGALERSGTDVGDVDFLCALHMKRSMHDELVAALGLDPARTVYLDDTGHMSGVDPLLGLDRAARAGDLHDGDLVLLLAAERATRGRRRSFAGGRSGGGGGAPPGSAQAATVGTSSRPVADARGPARSRPAR